MRSRFSPLAASAGFIGGYAAAVGCKIPLVTYLPLDGAWRAGRAAGAHPMYWYGSVLTATLIGLVAGLLGSFRLPRSR